MNRHLTTALAVTCAAALITVAAGCGSSSSAEVPTGADMKGTWTSTGSGYENGKVETWVRGTGTIIIDKAVGQAFSGNEKYTASGGVVFREPIQGVIEPDGDILIVEEDGFYEGNLENGVFTGEYAEIGDEPTALNVTLTKK